MSSRILYTIYVLIQPPVTHCRQIWRIQAASTHIGTQQVLNRTQLEATCTTIIDIIQVRLHWSACLWHLISAATGIWGAVLKYNAGMLPTVVPMSNIIFITDTQHETGRQHAIQVLGEFTLTTRLCPVTHNTNTLERSFLGHTRQQSLTSRRWITPYAPTTDLQLVLCLRFWRLSFSTAVTVVPSLRLQVTVSLLRTSCGIRVSLNSSPSLWSSPTHCSILAICRARLYTNTET